MRVSAACPHARARVARTPRAPRAKDRARRRSHPCRRQLAAGGPPERARASSRMGSTMSWRSSSKFGLPRWCATLACEPVKKLSITITCARPSARAQRGAGKPRPGGGSRACPPARSRRRSRSSTHVVAAGDEVVHQVAAEEAAAARHCRIGESALVSPKESATERAAQRSSGDEPRAAAATRYARARCAPSTRFWLVTGFALTSVLSKSSALRLFFIGEVMALPPCDDEHAGAGLVRR